MKFTYDGNKIILLVLLVVIPAILIFIPQLVLAADELFKTSNIQGSITPWDISARFQFLPPDTDLSKIFLTRMFGAVPGVLTAAGPTILGRLFGTLNAGIFTLVSVALAYSTGRIIMETTADGSSMGQKVSAWYGVRVALSAAILIPRASGYSIVNSIVMWIVVQGIGLADVTWTQVTNYVNQGGAVYSGTSNVQVGSNASQSENITTFIEYDQLDKPLYIKSGAADILRSEVGMYVLQRALQQKQQEAYNGYKVKYEQAQNSNNSVDVSYYGGLLNKFTQMPITLDYYIDTDQETKINTDSSGNITRMEGGNATFPYFKGNAEEFENTYGFPIDVNQLNGACGVYTWTWNDATEDYGGSATKYDSFAANNTAHTRSYLSAKRTGLEALANNLSGLAKQVVNNAYEPDNYPVPDGNVQLLDAAVQYQGAIRDMRMSPVPVVSNQPKLDDTKGWIVAGSYYRNLELASNIPTSLEAKHPRFTVVAGKYPAGNSTLPGLVPVAETYRQGAWNSLSKTLENFGMPKSDVDKASNGINNWIPDTVAGALDTANHIMGDFASKTGESSGISYKFSYASWNKWLDPTLLIANIMQGNFNSLTAKWASIMNEPSGKSPIAKLVELGHKMIDTASDIWYTIKVLFTVMGAIFIYLTSAAEGFLIAVAPLGFWGTGANLPHVGIGLQNLVALMFKYLQTLFLMSLPMVLAVTTPLFTMGIILAVYVPFIPFMLFTFGVVNWFISVFVVMVGAPIICFLMVWGSASGEHHLLGREAEQFVMQLLGIFLRPTLMVIGLVVGVILSFVGINVLNVGFATMTQNLLNFGGSDLVKMITNVGAMAIYTFMMVSLVNLCYSPIYVLYSESMRLAGVAMPVAGGEERHAEAVKGGISPMVEAGGAAGKGGAEASTGLMGKGDIAMKKMEEGESGGGKNVKLEKEENK